MSSRRTSRLRAAVAVTAATACLVTGLGAGGVTGAAAAATSYPVAEPGSMTTVNRLSGAAALWKQGITGAGVDVAVIDTGVTPVKALANKDKVVVGPDLSFDSQTANTRYLDTFGHGTVMSSIIAGREVPKAPGATYAADTTNYYGVAPDARIVSVKVGASNGAVDVSQLVAAIDWVVQNRTANGLNIRVLNLSLGLGTGNTRDLDPVAQAVEVASRAGILVVAAAGNDGQYDWGLANPAYDPSVLAVGAVDTKGTDTVVDDAVPSFSQHSVQALGARTPDLITPGTRIVAPVPPGSAIALAHPSALLGGGGYIRGSGTSQSAAVASGAAALLFQKFPGLGPQQVRELLMGGATSLPWIASSFQGRGELNLTAAAARKPASSESAASLLVGVPLTQSSGSGTLQGTRGGDYLVMDGMPLVGEKDIFGMPWSSMIHSVLASSQKAWTLPTGTFNGSPWIGTGFVTDTTSVAGKTWNGRTWSGRTWSGRTWSGRTWSGRTWSGRTWSGGAWTGGSWDGAPVGVPNGAWSSRTWSTGEWK